MYHALGMTPKWTKQYFWFLKIFQVWTHWNLFLVFWRKTKFRDSEQNILWISNFPKCDIVFLFQNVTLFHFHVHFESILSYQSRHLISYHFVCDLIQPIPQRFPKAHWTTNNFEAQRVEMWKKAPKVPCKGCEIGDDCTEARFEDKLFESTINRWHIKSNQRIFSASIHSHQSSEVRAIFSSKSAGRLANLKNGLNFVKIDWKNDSCKEKVGFPNEYNKWRSLIDWMKSIKYEKNHLETVDLNKRLSLCTHKLESSLTFELRIEKQANYVQQMSYNLLESSGTQFEYGVGTINEFASS